MHKRRNTILGMFIGIPFGVMSLTFGGVYSWESIIFNLTLCILIGGVLGFIISMEK